MTKTLYCNMAASHWDKPIYKKVTATKVAEIETNVENLYRAEDGKYYFTQRNNFLRRLEFVEEANPTVYLKEVR